MKKKFLISFMLLVTIFLPISVYAENNTDSEYKANVIINYIQNDQKELDNIPDFGSKAVYIANPSTGKVFYEKNAHEKMYPASTTKILTALVAMEKCQMTDMATVSKNAVDLVPVGYSNANLQPGEQHTIKDLLYALLLPSANEAANVLAEHISGSVEEFAELCNKRAKELGCETLHFVNANGMHDENHYCSAYDLYLVAKECQKFDIFNEIVKTKSYKLPSTKIYSGTRTMKNTNELLLPGTYYYSYCTGIKTGHTTPAGECLVASSSYNNLDLISVVLGGKTKNSKGLNDRFYDTKNLFEFTYDNHSIKEIAKCGDSAATIDVGKATKDTASLDAIIEADISAIIPNNIDKDSIPATISINENIVAPIEQNQVLGQISFYSDGLVYTTNIIASHSVEKLPYARYNIIVVISLIIIFVIFSIILKIFKKHKKAVLLIEILIFCGVCITVFTYVKNDMKNSITKINPVANITLNS